MIVGSADANARQSIPFDEASQTPSYRRFFCVHVESGKVTRLYSTGSASWMGMHLVQVEISLYVCTRLRKLNGVLAKFEQIEHGMPEISECLM